MPRPKKKEYDAEAALALAIEKAAALYEDGRSLADIAGELKKDDNSMNPMKVRKLLITGTVNGLCGYESDKAQAVLKLYNDGHGIEDIMGALQLSRASVYSYIPYKRVMYSPAGSKEASAAADRIRLCRQRKDAVAELERTPEEENLWRAVIAFQGYPFRTVSGLKFSYKLNTGRNGEYTKELLIDRRKESKSLSWSSVVLAFGRAMEHKDGIIARPKDLGDIRGISYIYPMFWRFGIIAVPEGVAAEMEIQQIQALAGRNLKGPDSINADAAGEKFCD